MQFVVTYRLDANERLVDVDSGWDAFALANGADRLRGAAVLGRSIWDLISDPDVRRLYTPLFRAVRERAESVEFPFRCDAPHAMRYMRMLVSPADGGGLVLRSILEREAPRAPAGVERKRQHGLSQMVQLCSSCCSLATSNGWVEVQAGIGDVTSQAELPLRVAYSYCPDCRARLSELAARTRAI